MWSNLGLDINVTNIALHDCAQPDQNRDWVKWIEKYYKAWYEFCYSYDRCDANPLKAGCSFFNFYIDFSILDNLSFKHEIRNKIRERWLDREKKAKPTTLGCSLVFLQPDSEKGDLNIWTSDKTKGQKVTYVRRKGKRQKRKE